MRQRVKAENFIDEKLLKCFSPIQGTLMLLGSSPLSIKNQLVTASSVCQKFYTLLCILAVSFSILYIELFYYNTYHDKDMSMSVACTIGALVQHVSYIVSIINGRFCKGEVAVDLCIKLQKVDSTLNLKEFTMLKDAQYYWNFIGVLLFVVPFQCGFWVHVIASIDYPIFTMFAGLGTMNVHLELLMAASLILHLAMRLRILNKIVKYNFHVKNYYSEQSPVTSVNTSLMISLDKTDSSTNLELEKFLICLKETLKLYKIITEVFSCPVFNIAVTLVFWALLVLLTMIIGLRTELLSTVVIVTLGLWIGFYFLLLMMTALVSDFFIQEVRQTKLHCIHAMSCRFEGPIWKGANDIFRTIQFYQPSFSVYGIFTLDKCLPFSLIGIIATNLVVLTQFTIEIQI